MFQQQGDVLIKGIGAEIRGGGTFSGIPSEAKRRDSRILAEGEATGHAHRAEGDCEVYELGSRLFMRVLSGNCRVVHEEHGPQTVPVGDYEIERVQEYDPFEEVARDVKD